MAANSGVDTRSASMLAMELQGPIAVMGAAGFIGANVFRNLISVRSDVFAITRQNDVPSKLKGCNQSNILQCDITESEPLRELFKSHGFRTILFFAAYGAYPKQSAVDKIYHTNVVGLANVLAISEEFGIASLVHAGSQSEYGLNCTASTEEFNLEPNSHYAVSKVAASYMIGYMGKQKSMPVINLRLYSVYGPYEEEDRLIPKLVGRCIEGGLPPLVSPQISRDFVYVEDVTRATYLAAIHGCKNIQGESVNVCSGIKTTIGELVQTARGFFDVREEPVWNSMQNRSWDLKDWYGNPDYAKQAIRWEATTNLVDGLGKTAEWRKQNSVSEMVSTVGCSDQSLDSKKISAIIACYKDAQAIPVMHERLTKVFKEMKVEYEIIFVNDSSPDNTNDVAGEIANSDPRVFVIEHSRNFGSQSAFLSGMAIATGDAVVLMDGDLQDPPELIPKFYERWIQGDVEVVYGRRIQREATMIMQFCYKAFYRVFQKLASVTIPLDAGDFSLIDRRVVTQLLCLPETDQFLRGLRAWVGFRQTGIDYIRPERMFGVSTNNWVRNLRWARKGIFSFSNIPLELLFLAGIALMGLAVFAVIGTVIVWLYDPRIPRGITTIVCLLLGFGGMQLFAIAVLGEYIGKILEETKRRPKFIVRRIQRGSQQFVTETEIASLSRRSTGSV